MKGNRFWRESRSQKQGSDRNPDFLDLPNNPNKRLLRRYPHQGNIKQEDEEGYPLSDFEDPSGSIKEPIVPDKHSMVRIKKEPKFSDSDQGDDSENDTYPPKDVIMRKANSSQQVSDVLSTIMKQQVVIQDQNLKVIEKLVNRSTNAFVLDDIPVFDGNSKYSIDFENWLLELDKAVEITGMGILELAFSKSSGTPHKMIKRLRREKTWEFIKEKLQITYSKLATDVHASMDLNQNCQKRHEPLEDFIERFYQNYKHATGEDPARTRNPHIINTFVRNLYNRDIRK